MSTDIMLGGSGVLAVNGGPLNNTAGCNAVLQDSTFPVGTVGTNWLDWQPSVPNPVPTYPAYPAWQWCNCHGYYSNTHCCKCSAKAMEEFAKLIAKGMAPMATPTVADTLLTQAKARIDEIQKRLNEVPALEAEVARLRRMVDAAEGK